MYYYYYYYYYYYFCCYKEIFNVEILIINSQKKSKFPVRYEPTTLHDLVKCFNHWATGDSGEQGWNVGLSLEPRRSHNQMILGTYELTNFENI